MAIKNFPNETAYNAAVKPTIESQVAMIENTKAVKYDGVNVITDTPQAGDPVFLDESNNPVIISAPTLIKANVPTAWTYVGEVIEVTDNEHARVLYKNIDLTKKWLDVCQYAWTDAVLTGTETTKVIGIRCSLDWANNTEVTCIYTATTLAEAAAAMQSAIESRLAELSATAAEIALWHCYTDTDNNRVIVQRDACNDYRFHNCSGLTHITWGDMPASSSSGFRINDVAGNERIMNIEKGSAYYGANGRTPTADVPLNVADGIVKKTDFNNSAYCAALRNAYSSYEDYIAREYLVKVPQKLGVFGLPDGKAMCDKYGPMMAPTKNGGTKAKFPALNWALTVGLNASGMQQGDWHLWDVREGSIIMRDDMLAKINNTRQKMGVTQIGISAYRWWAERCNVGNAWYGNGYYGYLVNANVNNALQVGAVTLLKFK